MCNKLYAFRFRSLCGVVDMLLALFPGAPCLIPGSTSQSDEHLDVAMSSDMF